eukprot:2397180-Rhodomonas_salina.1
MTYLGKELVGIESREQVLEIVTGIFNAAPQHCDLPFYTTGWEKRSTRVSVKATTVERVNTCRCNYTSTPGVDCKYRLRIQELAGGSW